MSAPRMAVTLANWFKWFRASVWFRVTYVVLLALIVAGLFPYSVGGNSSACLILFLIPITMFVIPYWMRERRVRNYLVNGFAIALIALLLMSALQAQSYLDAPVTELSTLSFAGLDPTINLTRGTVDPFRGPPSGTYTFRVFLRSTEIYRPSNYSVWLNLTIARSPFDITNRSVRMTPESVTVNTTDGVNYTTTQSLEDAVFIFFYTAQGPSGNWTGTDVAWAPIVAGYGSFFVLWLYIFTQFMVFPLLFYLMVVFMWWYTARSRERRLRMAGERPGEVEEAKEKEAKPGATKKAAAFTCTSCGADVTEDDERCPKCGAVFEE